MAGETLSTNMNMPIPAVGTTAGPTWASDYNASLTILDSHDHTTGNGVRITPSGLNINATLSFGSNAASDLLKASFTSQSGALTGTNFVSFVGGNLYVNDGSGNQIPITSGGGVAGSPGSIGGLASPASASYTAGSKLFTWLADSAKSAAMDNGAVTIRETNVASAKGVTIQSPTSLGADYSITLPTAVPASTQLVNMTSAGALGNISYDGLAAAMTSTGANAIATTRTRGTNTVSTGVSAAGGFCQSLASGFFSTASSAFVDVTNLSATLTTSGRPLWVGLVPNTNGAESYIAMNGAGTPATTDFVQLQLVLDGVTSYISTLGGYPSANYLQFLSVPASSICTVMTGVAAGSHTFKLQIRRAGNAVASLDNVKLVVYEIG